MEYYLPYQLEFAYRRIAKDLNLAKYPNEIFSQSFAAPASEKYNLDFWQKALAEVYTTNELNNLRHAYHEATKDALQLERWKVKLEAFPAWVRRLPEVRYIDFHVNEVMHLAKKDLHRREAVGLAFARMETLERKTKKKKRICFCIGGDSHYLGNKVWCEKLEDILPKGLTYTFAYSQIGLLSGSEYWKQIFRQLNAPKPHLYVCDGQYWLPRGLTFYDGLLWVGDREKIPFKNKSLVCCSSDLNENDRKNIMREYKTAVEKQKILP